MFTFKAEVCEACLALPEVLGEGGVESLGRVRQTTDGAYVRAAVAAGCGSCPLRRHRHIAMAEWGGMI